MKRAAAATDISEPERVGPDLVQLDRDHPGFRDPVYRRRRNEIAHLALEYREGDPVPEVAYTPEELHVWQVALEHLLPLHARYACRQHLECWPRLRFTPARIPQLSDVNAVLDPATGFHLTPVAGLVSPRVFMSELGSRHFLSTQYMRHHSAPLYTPEPDVIHELVGHAALLADPDFARINRLFGEATLRANERQVEALIRVYWYALEFGVVREREGLKVVGAGLLSSFGELGRFETHAQLRPFDIEEIARTPFDPTDYQAVLFVADGAGWLLRTLEDWLTAL